MPKHLILLATAATTGAFGVEVSSRYPIGVFAGLALYFLLWSLDVIFNGKPEVVTRADVVGVMEEDT